MSVFYPQVRVCLLLNMCEIVACVTRRFQVTARFANDAEDFAITDRSRRNVFSDRLQTGTRPAALTFTDFYDLPANDYYWLLPDKFLGNKVSVLLFCNCIFFLSSLFILRKKCNV